RGEVRRLPPGGQPVDALLGLADRAGVPGVHVDAVGAAVELRGADPDQLATPRYGPKRPKVRSTSVEETWAKELVGAVDLHLDLPGTRVRAGLEGALRDAIRAGRLRTGTRLPSSRALAADLGIARNTVAEVYSQLIAE